MASRPAFTRARRWTSSVDETVDSILDLLEPQTMSTSLTCDDDDVRSGALMAGAAGVGAYRFAGGTTAL